MEKSGYRKILFTFVTFLFWLANYFFVSTFSAYSLSAGATVAMVGIIASSYGLSQLLIRIPLGIVSDRTGKRKIFIIWGGFAVLAVATAGMALFPNPYVLFAGRFLTGVASSVWVCFTVLYASYFSPAESHKAISIMTLLNVTGPMVGTFLGGIASDKLGRASPFWLAAGVSALGAVLSFFIVETKTETKKQLQVAELLEVGKNRRLLLVSMITALVLFAAFGAALTYAQVLAQDLGANDTELGILTSLMSVAGIPATLLIGSRLFRYFRSNRVLALGLLVGAACCVLYPLSRSIGMLYAVQLVFGFARTFLMALCMSLAVESVEDQKKGTAMGFFQAIYSFGILFGPLVMGGVVSLSASQGLLLSFLLAALLMVIGAIVVLLPRRTVPAKE